VKHASMNVGRKTKAIIAVVSSVAAVVAAVGVVPSLAGWTHTEVDNGTLASLGCSTPGTFASHAWGQEIAGEVANVSLDSHLAGVLGTTVNSAVPHSAATGGGGSDPGGMKYWGNDAWSSDLQAGALNAIDLGAGITLPLNSNLGAETQYARATSTGVATGASGAVTTAGDGLVSLDSPDGSTPGVGSLDLDTALSAAIGNKLGGDVSELADASLTVGALGSTTSVDSCNDLWQGLSDASQVARNYVLAKLALNLNSSVVGTAVTDTTSGVNTLQTQLNALESNGSLLGLGNVTSALTTAISNSTSLVGVTIGGPTSVNAGVVFDLSGVLNDLTGTVTDGPVSINLGSGAISVDLAKLYNSSRTDLNGLDPNTSLLSPTLVTALEGDAVGAITGFLNGKLQTDLTAALDAAQVNVEVKTDIKVAGIDTASLDIHIKGTLGQFVDPTDNGNPVVTIDPPAVVGGVASLLSLVLLGLGINLTQLLTDITTGLVAPLLTGLVPAIGAVLQTNVLTPATADVTSTTGALASTTLTPVFTSLDGVLDVVGKAVQVTVNAQPDQPNGAGYPEPETTGEFFESALAVSVLDLKPTASPTLGLYFGSSAVGPDTRN
jgi:hypothetical protein